MEKLRFEKFLYKLKFVQQIIILQLFKCIMKPRSIFPTQIILYSTNSNIIVNTLIKIYLERLLNNCIRSTSNTTGDSHILFLFPYKVNGPSNRWIQVWRLHILDQVWDKRGCCEWSSSIETGNSNYTVRSRPIIVGEWFSMVTTSERFSSNWTWTNLAHSRKMKRMEEREKTA